MHDCCVLMLCYATQIAEQKTRQTFNVLGHDGIQVDIAIERQGQTCSCIVTLKDSSCLT